MWFSHLIPSNVVLVNIANLQLVRGTSQKRERFVRSALGARHGPIVRRLLKMARDDYETRRELQHQGVHLTKAAGKYAGLLSSLTLRKGTVRKTARREESRASHPLAPSTCKDGTTQAADAYLSTNAT